MGKHVDLRGKKHTLLTPLEFIPGSGKAEASWRCLCDCGGTNIVTTGNLTSGNVKSCGCLRHKAYNVKHGASHKLREYDVWKAMKRRCYLKTSKDYPDYGGRGIVVHPKWRNDFSAFFADMGPRPSDRHSIGRIDNDGPYGPENCAWQTPQEQALNKRPRRRRAA